jgi:hypothetical protein
MSLLDGSGVVRTAKAWLQLSGWDLWLESLAREE